MMNFEEWQENLKKQRGIKTTKPERKFEVINSSRKKRQAIPSEKLTSKFKPKDRPNKTRPKKTEGKSIVAAEKQKHFSVINNQQIPRDNASKADIMGLPILILARRYRLNLTKVHANSLAKKYFSNTPLTDQDFFDAHMYAMVALEKYGGQTLSLCLALPPVSFQSHKVYKAFRLLQKINNAKPSVSFFLKNPLTDNNTEQFILTFGLKEIGIINRQTAYLRHKNSNKVVAVLKDDGTITPTDVSRFYRSQLKLFFTVLDNPRQAFVTYGNSAGMCSICGRELTRHESAIKGVGPVCEKLLT